VADEWLTALEAWGREVERIVDGKPAKMLPLRRQK
jgi:hypothetical protein